MAIKDSSAADFDTDVIEASRQRGVVVDFWAPWCGPCHQLYPILEQVAGRYEGEVDLVKLNVDEAPRVAARFGVRGIPAVKAFRDGKPVAELTGVQPEPQVERLFAAVAPTEAERLVRRAADAPAEEREAMLRAAVEAEPTSAMAAIALAGLLAADGGQHEALGLLARFPTEAEAQRLRAEINLAADAADDTELSALRAAAGSGDAAARVRLGRALLAGGRHEEGLKELLAAVSDPVTREEARSAVLEAFAVLGDDHELVRSHRPRLAAALF